MMHRGGTLGLVLGWLMLLLPGPSMAQPWPRHDLRVVLQPEAHRLEVTDTITLPAPTEGAWPFVLHAGLPPRSVTSGVRIVSQPLPRTGPEASVPLASYAAMLPAGTRTFVVQYAGSMAHPLQAPGVEAARSFHDTPGTIMPEGVYLQASSFWYPQTEAALVTFTLEVEVPSGWEAVSQGKRLRHERLPTHTRVQWESTEPQEQIHLVAGPWTVYEQTGAGVQALAFLRTPEAVLAQQYLEATARYVTMYSHLLGPYPYAKFALVENFWETGFGMPSFTLLGSKVLRLPFILHSSYPHEILHNWWGNGVFVDAAGGNWSEGLTAYLADHLLQEQRGAAAEYRRTTLQKYRDYVTQQQDFALTAFRGRHDAVTEAVGYGKMLMFFHMLRQRLGDDAFVQALRTFYQRYRFQHAGFDALQQVFSQVAGIDLSPLFAQWLTRPGAPALQVRDVAGYAVGQEYVLTAVLEQVQAGATYYDVPIPIAVTLEGQAQAYEAVVPMSDARAELHVRVPARPLRLDIDPQFDVFRRVDVREIPPALTQMFGAEKVLMVLPSLAPEATRQGYAQLARSLQQSHASPLEVRWDHELEAWPDERSVWLVGWENRWRPVLDTAMADYDTTVQADAVRVGDMSWPRRTHTVVLTARQPRQPQHTLAWLATEEAAALPGLARKLPHYGKYSSLAFTGTEPTNVAKGQWPVLQSPLSVRLPRADGRLVPDASAALAPRQALATLPETVSAERMLHTIGVLASPAMRGRGLGTPELDQVAEFIAARFREAGLQPGGEPAGSYFQRWSGRGGAPEREVTLQNVIGVIPGRNPAWAGQSVVLGAHYDHLGLGWPDVHHGEEGKIHPGANDNASGIAVLLELARVLGKSWQPERSVVFVAFTAEEAGRLGSRHYVTQMTRFPVAQSIGMVNLDTVGRLDRNKLGVFGMGSAQEWPSLLQGAGSVSGTPIEGIAQDWGGSDQASFLEVGVPAVQLFSGAQQDYHRPTDTPEKIDAQGLVSVAAVTREMLAYLAARPTRLTTSLPTDRSGGGERPEAGPPSRRRVSFGTVPDFAYAGQGYRIREVLPDSSAAQAGLQAGDIIVQLGSHRIADLRAFADVLRTLQPEERITVTYRRGDVEHTGTAQLAPR